MLLSIVAATPFEIAPLQEYLNKDFEAKEEGLFEKEDLKIRVLITGVGIPLTALQLGFYLAKEQPDLLINAGVAGAFNRDLELGAVVHVIADCFGDLGVEEADGSFTNIHELGLIAANDAPFEKGILYNRSASQHSFLPVASGVTINTVHGHSASIQAFQTQYPVDVETMESAAVFLACLQTDVNFLAIRSISNYVEKRNRAAWRLDLAIENLNKVLVEVISGLEKDKVD